MRKHIRPGAVALALLLACTACTTPVKATTTETLITLSDAAVTVNGKAAAATATDPVYVGADIVYYQSGKDAAYGEGTDADAHTAAEAAAHTVVTITQPGTYRLTGALSAGQVAVDLGEGAEDDPDAVVTLILDNVDLTCTVAPAVIFYRVYECGSAELADATALVDTTGAGANVILADGSVNYISGSYVAKIYKEGTEKKLHKYDGAFYSKMSMNVTGGAKGDGVLNLTAANEGLDAELHLTINGGVIRITAQNDGINTNEDGVSVTTINGGTLTINAGLGAEGDGIDSNGFLVINGGTVTTQANPRTGDGGLDSDSGIYLNGGTVLAFGSRNDDISADSAQNWMELSFSGAVSAGSTLTVKDAAGAQVLSYTAVKDFQTAVLSVPDFALDTAYTLYVDGVQQQYTGTAGGMMGGGFGGGQRPDGTPPTQGEAPSQGEASTDGAAPPDGATPPEGQTDGQRPQRPEGSRPGDTAGSGTGTPSTAFTLTAASKRFSGVSAAGDSALPFTDVAAGADQYSAIQTLYTRGLMNGTSATTFSPDEVVSRAMAVTVLARLASAQASETADFTDVAAGSWYSGYVGWAVSLGLVQGDGQSSFMPDSAVTAAQMDLILSRYDPDYTAQSTSATPLTRGELAVLLVTLL